VAKTDLRDGSKRPLGGKIDPVGVWRGSGGGLEGVWRGSGGGLEMGFGVKRPPGG